MFQLAAHRGRSNEYLVGQCGDEPVAAYGEFRRDSVGRGGDEFLWSHIKTNGVSKKPLKQNESLHQRVEEDLVNIQDNQPLVRSFFGAKTVAYAAD